MTVTSPPFACRIASPRTPWVWAMDVTLADCAHSGLHVQRAAGCACAGRVHWLVACLVASIAHLRDGLAGRRLGKLG